MRRDKEIEVMTHNASGFQAIANAYQKLYMKCRKEIYSTLAEQYQKIAHDSRRNAEAFKVYK